VEQDMGEAYLLEAPMNKTKKLKILRQQFSVLSKNFIIAEVDKVLTKFEKNKPPKTLEGYWPYIRSLVSLKFHYGKGSEVSWRKFLKAMNESKWWTAYRDFKDIVLNESRPKVIAYLKRLNKGGWKG